MQTEMPDCTHIAIHPKSLRPAFLSAGGVSVSTPGQSSSRISDGRTAYRCLDWWSCHVER